MTRLATHVRFFAKAWEETYYYRFEDEALAPAGASSSSSAPLPPTTMPSPTAVNPVSLTPAVTIKDTPIKAIDVSTVIVAQNSGRFVVQAYEGFAWWKVNEIFQLEFTPAPEKGEGPPLEKHGFALGIGFGILRQIF